MEPDGPSMAELQEAGYGEGRDYTLGSPHLQHDTLRCKIETDLADLVADQLSRNETCRVLEVGAGHGTFTTVLADAGAQVTVTEMSEPSVRVLSAKFEGNDAVTVVHDADGTESRRVATEGCDLVAFISVLHHIPDYEDAVRGLVERLTPGGSFYSVQDPMWYPRRSRVDLAVDRGSYFLWRLGQGEVRRGLRTRWRRLRGTYDETDPSDMVEYHVVRQGVDEEALAEMLGSYFSSVEVFRYWSTQSARLQRLGDRLGRTGTFGIIARGRA